MRAQYLYQCLSYIVITLLLASCTSLPHSSLSFAERQANERMAEQIFYVMIGDIAMQFGRPDEASRYYTAAAIASSDEALFANALAILLRDEHYNEAERVGKLWQRVNPNNLLLNKALTITYIRSDRAHKALPHVERIIAHSADLYRSNQSARDILGLGLKPEIITEFSRNDTDNPYLLLTQALFALSAHDYQTALEQSRQALEQEPSLIRSYALIADALFGLGRVEEGLTLLETQAQATPHDAQLLLKSARQHFLYDRDYKALAAYQRFIRLYGKPLEVQADYDALADTIEAQYAIASIHLNAHDYQQARRLFQQLHEYAIDIDYTKEIQRSNYYLAKVDEEQAQYEEALLRYRSISEADLFLESRIAIARIFQKQKKYALSAQAFREALRQTNHDRTRIALLVAQAEMMQEFASKAEVLEVYHDALQRYPREPNVLYSRAMFAHDTGDMASAKRDLKLIIKHDERSWRALNALGFLLADANRNLDEAKGYLERAYQLQPHSAAVIDSIGWLEFRLNNLQLAEEYISRAANMQLHPEIMGHLAEVFLSQHKKQEALDVLKRALSHFPDNKYLLKLYEPEKDI